MYKHLREDLVMPRKTKVPGDGVSVTKKLGHPPLSDTTRPKMKSSTLIEPQSLLSVSQVRSFLPLSFPSFLPSFHSLPSLPLFALSRGPGTGSVPPRLCPGPADEMASEKLVVTFVYYKWRKRELYGKLMNESV